MKIMKPLKLIPVLIVMVIMLVFVGCSKSNADKIKSSSVEMKAVTSSLNNKSSQNIEITATHVNITNLRIEENSGNDGENVEGGNYNNNDGDNKQESEGEDVLLAGPFSLDITNGAAMLGVVDVYPGTFKKVDFYFQTNSSEPYDGSSILIGGNYIPNEGSTIPFLIKSAFIQQVQLPLAGSGVTVIANSNASIYIVFNVNAWVSGIEFASATIVNDVIIIDKNSNAALLSIFETNLANFIDVEGK